MFGKIRHFLKDECGNYMVLFMFMVPVIFTLAGMAVDIGMMQCKRLKLEEVGQVIREIRFEESDVFLYDNDPKTKLLEIMQKYAEKNGLKAEQVSVEYQETRAMRGSLCTERNYTMKIILDDKYDYTIMKAFGYDTADIHVEIKGSGYKKNSNGVWYPGAP